MGIVGSGLATLLWIAFISIWISTPEWFTHITTWAQGLPLVLEIIVWIVFLPWMVSIWIWDSPWALWLRILLIVIIALATMGGAAGPLRRRK